MTTLDDTGLEDTRGRSPRRSVPRGALGALSLHNRDPREILAKQNSTRIEALVPLRFERMSADPFAFYRGTTGIMAADQGSDPHSGILVGSCGDAHIGNFGLYASPQRTLVFDLNDFDEAAWAPWEWDLKRLVTSVIVSGRATQRSEKVVEEAALRATHAYIQALRAAVQTSPLDRYYTHFDPEVSRHRLDKVSRRALRAAQEKARRRTGARAVRRLTKMDAAGRYRFIESPPVMTHVGPDLEALIEERFQRYRRSAYVDIRILLSQYVIDDVARRVVGVGSVGTRCYLSLLRHGADDLFILQVKEARQSVIEEYGGIPQPPSLQEVTATEGEGARVVGMQRILQAYSDPFLGHIRVDQGDFYVRQFQDMKGSFDIETLEDVSFIQYGAACASVLARAHSQSPAASEVVSYIGNGRKACESIVSWSEKYADLSLRDYKDFVEFLEKEGARAGSKA